jgi:hypothetical protein
MDDMRTANAGENPRGLMAKAQSRRSLSLVSGKTGLKQLQDTTTLVDWHFQEFFDLFSPDHCRHFVEVGSN